MYSIDYIQKNILTIIIILIGFIIFVLSFVLPILSIVNKKNMAFSLLGGIILLGGIKCLPEKR